MKKNLVCGTVLPHVFGEKKSRIVAGANPENKTGFKYEFIINEELTKKSYAEFQGQIPESAGALIVLGWCKDNTTMVLDVVTTSYNLREEFLTAKGYGLSRKNWLLAKIHALHLKGVLIQLAKTG